MPIVVYKNGVMASDMGTHAGDYYTGDVVKVLKHKNTLYGCVGNISLYEHFFSKLGLQEFRVGEKFPMEISPNDDFQLMAVEKGSDKIIFMDNNCLPYEVMAKAQGHAIGSGMPIALGALFAGADAVTAVEAAIYYNCTCRQIGPCIKFDE